MQQQADERKRLEKERIERYQLAGQRMGNILYEKEQQREKELEDAIAKHEKETEEKLLAKEREKRELYLQRRQENVRALDRQRYEMREKESERVRRGKEEAHRLALRVAEQERAELERQERLKNQRSSYGNELLAQMERDKERKRTEWRMSEREKELNKSILEQYKSPTRTSMAGYGQRRIYG